jgi:inner membrane protein
VNGEQNIVCLLNGKWKSAEAAVIRIKQEAIIRYSATLKIVSISLIIFVLMIPAVMISSLLYERESRRNSVVSEINQKWGSSQVITGPFFTVPYKTFYTDKDDKVIMQINYLHILPEKLNVSGNIASEIRYRSLYEAVLYNTELSISGNFKYPSLVQTDILPENILWEKATFSMGITDMKGIQKNIEITFDGKKYGASPGLKTNDLAYAGVSCLIPLSSDKANAFSLVLNLNGSEELQFVPSAEETNVSLKSTWPTPSFNGAFLPTTREISDKGFSAVWKVLHLNRNFPQLWQGSQYNVNGSSFGLNLLITADVYQKATRISKYDLMFIVFTFAAFFLSEIINKQRVHPIQYLLIGLAIVLFYVLLLAISEHVNFDYAYLISALATTTLITGYSQGIIRNKNFTATVFGILVTLYLYMFIVLQLEDYALIMGSVGLFSVLSAVMFISRKVDWYNLGAADPAPIASSKVKPGSGEPKMG